MINTFTIVDNHGLHTFRFPVCFRQFPYKVKLEKNSQILLFYIKLFENVSARNKRKLYIFSLNIELNYMCHGHFNYLKMKTQPTDN